MGLFTVGCVKKQPQQPQQSSQESQEPGIANEAYEKPKQDNEHKNFGTRRSGPKDKC